MQFIYLYLIIFWSNIYTVIFSILGKIKEPTAFNSAVGSDDMNSFSRSMTTWSNVMYILKLLLLSLSKGNPIYERL